MRAHPGLQVAPAAANPLEHALSVSTAFSRASAFVQTMPITLPSKWDGAACHPRGSAGAATDHGDCTTYRHWDNQALRAACSRPRA